MHDEDIIASNSIHKPGTDIDRMCQTMPASNKKMKMRLFANHDSP